MADSHSKSEVLHNCANWDSGNCLGAVFKIEYSVIGVSKINQTIVKSMCNKPCKLINNKSCEYWDNYVVPSIGEENK